jgi:hypothetical protein
VPHGCETFEQSIGKNFYFDLEGAISSKKFPPQKGRAFHLFCNAMCRQKKKKIFIFGQCFTLGIALGKGCYPSEAVLSYDSVLSSHFFFIGYIEPESCIKN